MIRTLAQDPVLANATRDYVSEMNERIAELTSELQYAVPDLTIELYNELLESDPDLLNGFLHAIAQRVLGRAIGEHVRAQRSRARSAAQHSTPAERFSAAAQAWERGDSAALDLYVSMHVVNPEMDRKRACDMTGSEHRYVARQYARSAVKSGLLNMFHLLVADRVGEQLTSQAMNATEYQALYNSMTRGNEDIDAE